MDTANKQGTIKLKNLDVSKLPSFVWYLKPDSSHGERFQIDLGNIKWKSTSSDNLSINYKLEETKNLATTFGAIYELANAGVTSYVYNGDLNGDGNSGNDLLYIPKTAADINLVKVGSGGLGTGTSTDVRTAAQIWSQVDAFISNSTYLNTHRGQYAQRNAVVLPYFSRLDLNVTQEVKVKVGGVKHTVKIAYDLINAGNFISRDWGVVKIPTVTNFLKYEGLAADGKTPSFSFPFQTGTTPFTQPYQSSTGIGSRWQMQIGVKYMFN